METIKCHSFLLTGVFLLHVIIPAAFSEKISYFESTSVSRLLWSRIGTVCMKRNLTLSYRIVYNADRGCCPKLLLYSDRQYQTLVYQETIDMLNAKSRIGLAKTGERKKNYSAIDIIKRLHDTEDDLMSRVQTKLERTYSCAQVKKSRMQVLDESQVVKLCQKGSITIGNNGKSYKMCEGNIKLMEKVSLPNMTLTESWYGGEADPKTDRNPEESTWVENTWHIVLTNCPSNGPLQISYDIAIDSIDNLGKSETGMAYRDPSLESRCPTIMLPDQLSSIKETSRGARHYAQGYGLFCLCLLCHGVIFSII